MREKKTDTAENLERSVCEARERFQAAANAIDPLKFVRRHPKTGVSCAFLVGIGTGALARRPENLAVVPLVLEIAQLLLKITATSRP